MSRQGLPTVPERVEFRSRPAMATAITLALVLVGASAVGWIGLGAEIRSQFNVAQILTLLLQAGPTGLSASALSRALFGDDQHLVTARAEVSRLRRAVGALVATQPYRLADGVSLTLIEGH